MFFPSVVQMMVNTVSEHSQWDDITIHLLDKVVGCGSVEYTMLDINNL